RGALRPSAAGRPRRRRGCRSSAARPSAVGRPAARQATGRAPLVRPQQDRRRRRRRRGERTRDARAWPVYAWARGFPPGAAVLPGGGGGGKVSPPRAGPAPNGWSSGARESRRDAMFKGSFVALITPFAGGKVDEKRFQDFVDWQIKEGTHGLVPVGTTGES